MTERITVSLTPRAATALRTLTERTGLSKTDVVNRALQIYAFVEGSTTAGGELVVRWPGGDVEKVRFL